MVDLGKRQIAFADGRDPSVLGDDTAATIADITGADAVIFATPVYRGSMTGSLKNLFDQIPVPALEGKVVGLVAMGASDHHFLGAERHLRDVLSFFGALPAPTAVYLTSADFTDGDPSPQAIDRLVQLIDGVATIARPVSPCSIHVARSP